MFIASVPNDCSLVYILAQEVFDVLEVARFCHGVVVASIGKFFPHLGSFANLEQAAHV